MRLWAKTLLLVAAFFLVKFLLSSASPAEGPGRPEIRAQVAPARSLDATDPVAPRSGTAYLPRDHLFPASTLQTPGWLVASSNLPPSTKNNTPRVWVSDVQYVTDFEGSAGVFLLTQNMRYQQTPYSYESQEEKETMLDDPLEIIESVSIQILDAPYESSQWHRDRSKRQFLRSGLCRRLVTGTGEPGEQRRPGDQSQRYCTDEMYCAFDADVTEKLRAADKQAYLKVVLNLRTPAAMKDYYYVVLPFSNPTSNAFFRRTRRLVTDAHRSKDTISLCLTGVYHRPRYLRELMLFRLAQGYDHIYVGVENDGTESDAHQLRDLMEERRISVIPMEFLQGGDCHSKIPFLQSCLWHSKNFDRYTSVYDHDENLLWSDASLPLIQVVEDTVRANNLQCQVELRHSGGSLRPWDTSHEYFGEAFPDRGRLQVKPAPGQKQDPGHSHVRTILFTQQATYAGLHCGACGMQFGFCNQWPYDQQFNNSPGEHGLLLVHEADMRSIRSEGYPEGYQKLPSEYLLWFPSVKAEMAKRCQDSGNEPAFCPPYSVP